MARTKQTARKATGGSAARVNLELDGAGDVSTVAGQDEIEVCEEFQHNDFCIICRDGSIEDDYLLLCDECPRVVCTNCVTVPPAFAQAVAAPHVTFRCICCHITGQCQGGDNLAPYFGFYMNNKPLLDSFLPIRTALELNITSQLSSDHLLFIHLTLVDYDTAGGSFKLAHQFLMPYFPNASMEYHKVTFDVGTVSKVNKYRESMDALVGKLSNTPWKRIVFGISNHTDNESGDPFVGYDRKSYAATPVNNFLDIILGPWRVLIDQTPKSFLWLFSCGALVNNPQSFSKLRVSVAHHGVSAAIAFNAVRFQPSFSAHLLLAFCELVLIQRLSIQQAFPDMLGQSYKLGRDLDIFLLSKHDHKSIDVFKYCWTHTQLRPWGNFLLLQCPECGLVYAWNSANRQKISSILSVEFPLTNFIQQVCLNLQILNPFTLIYNLRTMSSEWTLKFKSILDQFEQDFLSNQDSPTGRSYVVKKVKNAILKAQGEQPGVSLPSALKKAIRTYYYENIDSEESDKEVEPNVEDGPVVTAEEREAAARPKTALFYKKDCNEWDVAKKLFKQEIDDYDKAERLRKGLADSIKYRTGHAREWFKRMSIEQGKEVKDAKEKWNREGMPQEIQAIHESEPQSVKKKFSVSSNGTKEWSSTGFKLFAEWSKTNFYPVDEDQEDLDIDDSDVASGLPELILDEEGYAKLPLHDGVVLKGQQDLIRYIFLASYKVFTKSSRPVPWRQIVANASHYLEAGCIPEKFVVRDPSHMRSEDVNLLWHHWERQGLANKKLVIFINVKKGDKVAEVAEKEGKKRQKKDYVEVVSSDKEEVRSVGSDSTEGRIAPADFTVLANVLFNGVCDERWVFLKTLYTDMNYLELVEATSDLAGFPGQMWVVQGRPARIPHGSASNDFTWIGQQ
ncbi:hypothetical protein F4604DRAFT_1690778 [Suillus subluteus]|nr:hypothetical protein F4604DRAFT_1690778 [Suillus subluteus]